MFRDTLPGGPPWLPILQPDIPQSAPFWHDGQLYNHLIHLEDTVNLLKSLKAELHLILTLKENADDSLGNSLEYDGGKSSKNGPWLTNPFSKAIKENMISLEEQESLALEAAEALVSNLKLRLAPLESVISESGYWEERSMAIRLANKIGKKERKKRWKKRKRKKAAEMLLKERENYERADQEADDWRAREIAKGIARRKMEKMKEIAKLKAIEERHKLESELELVLVVEKLQELRSIRIQKMKKQGHFLPEEDDKFLEQVRAAVEEEERKASEINAAKDAIAFAEESRKCNHITTMGIENKENDGPPTSQDQFLTRNSNERSSGPTLKPEVQGGLEGQSSVSRLDFITHLPIEFYQYYYGSNSDMGALIEVRRMWDAYIRSEGSRIPGHWVQPPTPADAVWASYLVRPQKET